MTKFLKNVDVTGYVSQTSVTSSLVKTDSSGKLVAAVAGTDYATPGALASADKMVTIGRNATGATLYQGTVVYISGSTGNRPNFVKAQANGEATSAGTFGVVLADIPNNSDGNVVTIGAIDNLDTRSGATNPFTSDTLVDGDTIYLSPTTAGYITRVKPSAPNHIVYVGKVVRTSPTNGTIVYRIQNGYELDEIHDVAISSLANNHTLVWESATSLWKNKTIAATLGYTPADDSAVVKLTGDQTVAGVKTFTSVVNAPTLSLNGGVLAGNNIVSMRSNPTGGQFRIEKSDGSLSAYPFYIGADGTALAYYYNASGALKVLLHTDNTSYFGNSLSVGYASYAATSYMLDVNGTARFTNTVTIGNFDTLALRMQAGTSTGSSYLRFFNSAGTARGYFGLFWSGTSDYMVMDAGALEMNFGSSNKFTFTGGGTAQFSGAITATNITLGTGTIGSIPSWMKVITTDSTQSGLGAVYNNKAIYVYNNGSALKIDAYDYATSTGLDIQVGGNGGKIILSNGQVRFTTYTSATSYTGTAAGYLAFDSSGNVITVAGVAATDSTKLPLAGGTMTGQLVIGTTGVANSPSVRINTSSSASFVHTQENFAANITAGQRAMIFFGKAGSTKNAGGIGYYWSSDASNNNFITLGHWGNDDLLRVYGDGTVTIGTNTVLHASNYSSYAVPLSGGIMTGALQVSMGYPYVQLNDTIGSPFKSAYIQYGVTTGGSGASGGGYFLTYSQDKPFAWTVGSNGGIMTLDTSGNLALKGILQMSTSGTSYISMGRFPISVSNSGEAWLGRASDRSTGSMTVQLGGSSNTSFFEVVDYGWSTVTFKVGMNDFSYKGNAVIHAGNISAQSVSYASNAGALTSMNISQFTNNSGYITSSGNAASVTYYPNRNDSAYYQVLWGAPYTNSVGTIAYSTAGVAIQSSTGTLVANTLSVADCYAERMFDLGYFTNGVSNWVSYIDFGNIQNSGYLEVEINSTYSNQNATGLLRKILPFGTNPNGGQWYLGDSKVQEANGSIPDNIFIGDLEWSGSNFRLPIYHVVSSGNAFRARVKYFTQAGNAAGILNAATISATTRTAPANWTNNPAYNRSIDTRTIRMFNNDIIGWRYSSGDSNMYNYIYNSYDDTTTGITYRAGNWTSSQGIVCHRFQTYSGNWTSRLTIYQDGGIVMPGRIDTGPIYSPTFYSSNDSSKYFTNNESSYGAWYVNGSQSGYSGFRFQGNMQLMMHTNGVSGPCGLWLNNWSILTYVDSAQYLYHNGSEKFRTDSGGIYVTGTVYATGDVIAYYSDIRLKKDVTVIENALDKIQKLRGVTYTWNDEKVNQIKERAGTRDIGLIAQEVEAVEPLLITEYQSQLNTPSNDPEEAQNFVPEMSETYKTIKYEKLVGLLIEGIKEQQAQIEQLKLTINDLTK